MRLVSNLLRSGGALTSDSASNFTDCDQRPIRLWMHIDMTGSFNRWRGQSPKFLKKSLTDLIAKYPNLTFGISGFGDRPALPIPQTDNLCYYPGVEFDEPYDDKKQQRMADWSITMRDTWNDPEEDPLTAMPWIAKHKFGDYKNNELRILAVITDYGPHYAPLYAPGDKTGTDDPTALPEDFVTCDSTKRWGYVDELMDPVKTRRIYPLFGIYPQTEPNNSWDTWTAAVKLMKYDLKHLVSLGSDYNPDTFTKAIEDVIAENKCDPAPTDAPSSGTIQTDPSDPSATPNPDASTTVPQGSTTIAGESTTITTATATTKENHNEIPVIVGASAGIAALLAAGAGYRLLKPGEPALDIEEEEGAQAADEAADREAAVALGEDAYE